MQYRPDRIVTEPSGTWTRSGRDLANVSSLRTIEEREERSPRRIRRRSGDAESARPPAESNASSRRFSSDSALSIRAPISASPGNSSGIRRRAALACLQEDNRRATPVSSLASSTDPSTARRFSALLTSGIGGGTQSNLSRRPIISSAIRNAASAAPGERSGTRRRTCDAPAADEAKVAIPFSTSGHSSRSSACGPRARPCTSPAPALPCSG